MLVGQTIRRLVPLLIMLALLAACGAPPLPNTTAAPTAQEAGATTAVEDAAGDAADVAATEASVETVEATELSAATEVATVDAGAAPAETATAAADATTDAAATAGAAEATPEAAGSAAGDAELTIYSGRSEELVAPLIEQYQEETGITVNVRYGDTAELAATILEEGANSPADLFFAQDAGALGALGAQDRLQPLPASILERVDERFRSTDGEWVGVSGRARVVVYNGETLTEADLPDSIFGFTDPAWKGRLGWAPTNGSFQAFVTALRVIEGEDRAREWLEGIQANEPKVYEGNTPIVQAVAAGEIDAGFVNHYYLFQQIEEQGESFAARNFFLQNGDPGALVNVAGVGMIAGTERAATAQAFIEYLLSARAQMYFADETYEYPLVEEVAPNAALPPLSEIQSPDLDLNRLEDLEGTLQLLQDLGIL